MIKLIIKNELKRIFLYAKGLYILAFFTSIMGFLFRWLMQDYTYRLQASLIQKNSLFGITEEVVHPFLAWSIFLFLLILPIFTMNSISSEKKNNTLILYHLSPISVTELIVAKFLSLLAVFFIFLSSASLMPISILISGSLDWGQFLVGLFFISMALSTLISIGIFISSLNQEPWIAAFITLLVFLSICLGEWLLKSFKEFAFLYHLKNGLNGLFSTHDLFYFITLSLSFLVMSHWQIKRHFNGCKSYV
ncbi:MAG: putative transporter, permease protein [Francisellaceae bacterium]|nr:putative transporter, permease protein [Francisellaceae bacterium]